MYKNCKYCKHYLHPMCNHPVAKIRIYPNKIYLRAQEMRSSALCDREAKLFDPNWVYKFKQLFK